MGPGEGPGFGGTVWTLDALFHFLLSPPLTVVPQEVVFSQLPLLLASNYLSDCFNPFLNYTPTQQILVSTF